MKWNEMKSSVLKRKRVIRIGFVRSSRMMFIVIDESSIQRVQKHMKEIGIRMISIVPIIRRNDIRNTKNLIEERISESMTLFGCEISEDTIWIITSSINESSENESISPIFNVKSVMDSQSIRRNNVSVPTIERHDERKNDEWSECWIRERRV